jgi:hypothetical protein
VTATLAGYMTKKEKEEKHNIYTKISTIFFSSIYGLLRSPLLWYNLFILETIISSKTSQNALL